MFRHTLFPSTKLSTDELDKMIDSMFGAQTSSYPAVDIYTENDKTVIEVAVTGFAESEINTYIEADKLIIEGKKLRGELTDKKEYSARKIAKRDFSLSYKLLKPVADIKAKLEYGILTLVLETEEAKDTRKQITISK